MFNILRIGALGNQTISKVFSMWDNIDLNPDYQRVGNIWDLRRKQLLIDSILNGYDLPKFYFHFLVTEENELNQSGKGFAVIDGKQRLKAINEFLQGKITLASDFIYLKQPEIELKGYSYKDIAANCPEIKTTFDNYILDIVFVKTDEQDRLEELFLRLNEGEPLNNAERRNAIGGQLIRRISTIVNEDEFFLSKVKFSNKRYEHQDILSKIILLERDNGFISFTKRSLDKLIEENKQLSGDIIAVLEEVSTGLAIMNRVFKEKDPLLKTKSVVPLYYWFIKSWVTQIDQLRSFLDLFEKIRKENRSVNDGANPILLEFDRLNQQGANQRKSLERRYTMLSRYFEIYLKLGDISVHTPISSSDILDDNKEDMV